MNHASLVKDLVARTGLPVATVETVVAALADLVRGSHAREADLVGAILGSPVPPGPGVADPRDPAAVAELVEKAKAHPLGLDYLRQGHLGSVAATFETHAFTVLAARDLLR